MNLSEAKKMVVDLLDEETADEFADKLPAFYDFAQKQIATTVDYIEKNITLQVESEREIDVADELDGKRLYLIRKILTDGDYEHIYGSVYRFGPGEFRIFCCVYPDTLTERTPETYEFEVSPEAQPAIVYFAAAQTVITDTDQRPYYAFMDRYNNILQNINDARRNNITVKAVKL